jgi:hypothetical protein
VLFADGSVVVQLQTLEAGVALMLSDLSSERAAVIKQLNHAGIPVVAVPLVPVEAGYHFTVDNAPLAAARYDEWKTWSSHHGLVWAGVGLDIEPDARFYQQLIDNPWRLLPMLLPRLGAGQRVRRARADYQALIARIRSDGYTVENYQFPLIADERWAGSTLLQRLLGLVDVRTDREVWMLYSSVLGRIGPGLLWVYASEAEAAGIGSTGGGPDIPGHPKVPASSWDAFARDLHLASSWCNDLLIHSLEGCVEQGFLPRLGAFKWDLPVAPPNSARAAAALRGGLRGILLASVHPWRVLAAVVAIVWLMARPSKKVIRRSSQAPVGSLG